MELIDRYVTEVSRRLALVRGHVDVERDIRAALEQRLTERAAATGQPVEDLAVEVLREFGPPARAAMRFNPYPYLVGPRVFPLFLMVAKIVLTVLVTVLLVLTAVSLARLLPASGSEIARAVGEGLAGIVSAVLGALGGMVLVFAILERFVPDLDATDEDEWDPLTLQRRPAPDVVKPSEAIVSIVVTALAIALFTAGSHLLGLRFVRDGAWVSVPLLSDAFFRWLPLLVVSWLAEIALQVMLLRAERWTTVTRLVTVVIKLAQLAVLILFLTGPSLLALTPAALQDAGFAPDAAASLAAAAQLGIRIALGLAIIGTVIEIIRKLVEIAAPKPPPPSVTGFACGRVVKRPETGTAPDTPHT